MTQPKRDLITRGPETRSAGHSLGGKKTGGGNSPANRWSSEASSLRLRAQHRRQEGNPVHAPTGEAKRRALAGFGPAQGEGGTRGPWCTSAPGSESQGGAVRLERRIQAEINGYWERTDRQERLSRMRHDSGKQRPVEVLVKQRGCFGITRARRAERIEACRSGAAAE